MKTKLAKQNYNNVVTPAFSEKTSLLFWAILAFIVIYMFFIPYNYIGPALFNGNTMQFEPPIYTAVLWSSIFLMVLSIFYFFHWRLQQQRDVLSMAIWLIPLSYTISLFGAASHQLASNMLLIVLMYTIFFLFGNSMSRFPLGATILQMSLVISGYAVVLFGFLNLFGNVYYRDAVMITEIGLRLTSLFQYANAYAAFLMAILFGSLYYIVNTRKWYWVLLHALMLVPILSSLWLTQSRGGYLLLPVILVLMLPFVSVAKQILLTLYLVIGFAASILLTNKFIAIGQPLTTKFSDEYNKTNNVPDLLSIFNSVSLSGWGRLILASAIIGACVVLVQRYVCPFMESKLTKLNKLKLGRLVFPIALLVLGAIAAFLLLSNTGVVKLLPNFMAQRLENINFNQHSVLERGTVYKDALKIIKDYPIFGAGGGAWAAMWEKYQNNPYIVRQAHNFFIQYTVDVGIFGFLLLIGILGWVFFRFVKKAYLQQDGTKADFSLIYFIFAISLLAHSIIDFEMSYVYIGTLLFLCLGGMSSIPSEILSSKTKLLAWPYWRWVFPAAVSLIGLITLIFSIINLQANSNYNKSVSAMNVTPQKPFNEILAPLDQALSLKPNDPDYVLTKINLMDQAYEQTKDEKYYVDAGQLINRLKKNEPHNRGYYEEEYKHLIEKQQTKDALDLMQQAIVEYPWDMPVHNDTQNTKSYYERAVELDGQLVVAAINDKNAALQKQYVDQAVQTYSLVQKQIKHLLELPKGQNQGRDFGITPDLQLAMGKIKFFTNDYAATATLLKPYIKDNLQDATNRDIALYYIAALLKQKQNDQALYDRLLASNPSEKGELDKLIN
ncbi:MAG: O-antigen polymerase [Bacilli bacterium]|nr:O-antigen polymerase [Bacilli bacterium]